MVRKLKTSRFKKLLRMNCWDNVYDKIELGMPIEEIATYIQEEAKEYTDVRHVSLVTVLYKFVQDQEEEDPLDDDSIKSSSLHRAKKVKKRIEDHSSFAIDPEDALNCLGAIAVDRCMIEFRKENSQQKTSSKNSSNIRLARDIYSSLADIQINKKKVGMIEAPTNSDSTAHIEALKEKLVGQYGKNVAKILTDPAKRQRIIASIQKFKSGANRMGDDFVSEEADRVSSMNTIDVEAEGVSSVHKSDAEQEINS